ncbi:MAG: TonB-dependent receptor [Brevundimonas sp.]|jgi:iron complex outermembrane receptor protein|uniref:TonB-dependent receptor n=1 Tax=Brevundimonas sp. TaxID=1871086 RepID=UPI0025C09C81|nr:TonB-dependent receptor [Brevundimonas sp.]MCH4269686.1 TonB-dependent receptor [Brevundimonas sp.]
MKNRVLNSPFRRHLASHASSAVLGLLAASIAQTALAQSVAPEPVAQDQTSATALDEVVVTARRREERLKDVPISAVAISGEQIANRNIVALDDLGAYTPNFKQTPAIISPYRVLRGVSSGSNFSFDQAVGAFTDGLYIGRAQLGRLPFYDIDRVEVLRGPQVILFGNSTTGGALSTTTRKPGFDFAGDFRASYEFANEETIVEGGVTLPFSQQFAVRVAGFSQVMKQGWVKGTFDGVSRDGAEPDTQAIRVTALWQPNDKLSATLRYERADINVYGGIQEVVLNRLNNPLVAEANFDRRRTVGSPAPFGVDRATGVPDDYIHLDPQIWLGTIDYQLGDFTLTSQTGYLDFDFAQGVESDWVPAAVAQIVQGENYRQFSQEFRISGEVGGFLDLQAGAYYQKDNKYGFRRFQFNPPAAGSPLPPIGLRVTSDQDSESWSAFADLIFKVTDRLRVGVGARYTETERTTDQTNHAVVAGTGVLAPIFETTYIAPGRSIFSALGGTPHDYLGIEDSESHLQPQVLVQYDLAPNVMGYVKYVKGAKAGGYDWSYQGATPRGGVFLPEQAESYEGGVKGTFLNRSLSLDLQVFRTDFTDLQVSAYDGVSSQIVRNAAAQRSQGVELEGSWRPLPALTLNFNGAYLDSKYLEFPGGTCNVPQRLATPAGVVCTQDLSGTTPPFLSKWSGNFAIQYAGTAGDFEVTPRLEIGYRSSYNASTNNDPAGMQSGYTTIDGRIQLTKVGAPWTVAVFGKNLTDELHMEFFLDAPLLTGVHSATSNRGRQIGVQVSAKF